MSLRSLRFPSGSLTLEGRIAVPEGDRHGGLAICHPHPLHRGSMSLPLIPELQRHLAAAGLVVLRFNFRGVGRSEGAYDGGAGETDDARAALDVVAAAIPPGAPLAIVGWSFGALVALRAATADVRVNACIAIAPPFGPPRAGVDRPEPPPPEALRAWPGRILAIAGGLDDLAPPEPIAAWASDACAAYERIDGADHFFRNAAGPHVARLIRGFLGLPEGR